jgi:hypothetical protein
LLYREVYKRRVEQALAERLPGFADTTTLASGATVLRMLLEPTERTRSPRSTTD